VPSGTAQDAATGRLIKIETSMGNMVLMLYDETPRHRDNMIKLIEDGFYRGQLFHRVIKDFMIQGGDPHSVEAERGQRLGVGGPGYTIPAEFNERFVHKKGALAAARRGDNVNPEKASSGSQFYIVQGRVFTPEMLKSLEEKRSSPFPPEAIEAYTTLGGTPHLDGAYTVFGELVEGFDVLDRIAALQTDSNNRPLEDVVYTISILK
jgi:peptidyl-prolyl cis-trans isomerase B (cyclophilin B)